jgi:hypothetical protein
VRPTPIPDDELEANPGCRRQVIGPPPGFDYDGPIAAIEALVGISEELGTTVYRFRCVLEDDDLERLTAGMPVWVSFCGRVVPWSIQVG